MYYTNFWADLFTQEVNRIMCGQWGLSHMINPLDGVSTVELRAIYIGYF